MRARYILSLIPGLIIIANVFLGGPGPGESGWVIWGMAKVGNLVLAALAMAYGIRGLLGLAKAKRFSAGEAR